VGLFRVAVKNIRTVRVSIFERSCSCSQTGRAQDNEVPNARHVTYISATTFNTSTAEVANAWTRWAGVYTVMTLLFGIAAGLLVTILVRVGGWQARRS